MDVEISIVLPVYNGEKLLGESIESVINQTFSNWELIVVNDCSTDGTRTIIEKYMSIDSRIKLIDNEVNQKLPKSLNIGFNHAKGKYLTWTSDDNQYYPKALEYMYLYLEEHNEYPMVCAREQIVDEKNQKLEDCFSFNLSTIPYMNCIGACFLYRAEVLDTVGNYDPEMYLVEDYDYWIRILIKYRKIGYIDERLYQYRWHDNSLSQRYIKGVNYQRNILRKKYLKYILDSLSGNGMVLEIFLIFCALNEDNMLTVRNVAEFQSYLPELGNIILGDIKNEKRMIVYGAGKRGEEFLEKNMEQVEYFVDSDKRKIGKIILGKEIISIEELKKIYKNYNVVITVSKQYQLEVMRTLFDQGIEFRVYV